ncbi:MAG: LamG-like jellyroll fold domain-containing protein [Methanobacterium sp.]
MTYVFRPVDGSLIFHLDPEGSRRVDAKVNNLAVNPNSRLFPALGFDGVDDYVNCGTGLNVSTEITICAKATPYAFIGALNRYILTKYTNEETASYGIGFSNTGNFKYFIHASSFVTRSVSDSRIQLYSPISIAFSYNGNALIGYINGVQVDTYTLNGNVISSTDSVLIGRILTQFYKGLIHKILLYNRALSPNEILANHRGEYVNSDGLLVDYFENGQGATLVDYSGNNNNGTIYGAVWNDGKANGTLIGGVTYKNSPSDTPVYNFDGSTGYIRVTPVRSARSNMSVFVWARASEENYIIGRYDTGLSDRSWIIGTDVAGEKRLRVLLSDDGTYGASHSKDYLTENNVFDNQWHMYGFTWDNGTLKLLVDGREQSVTKTYDAAFPTLKAASTDMVIGTRLINGSPAAYLTGQTGHTWIFNKTLLTSDAMQLFNETRRYYGR